MPSILPEEEYRFMVSQVHAVMDACLLIGRFGMLFLVIKSVYFIAKHTTPESISPITTRVDTETEGVLVSVCVLILEYSAQVPSSSNVSTAVIEGSQRKRKGR
jgi:hypothetical protein